MVYGMYICMVYICMVYIWYMVYMYGIYMVYGIYVYMDESYKAMQYSLPGYLPYPQLLSLMPHCHIGQYCSYLPRITYIIKGYVKIELWQPLH